MQSVLGTGANMVSGSSPQDQFIEDFNINIY